MPIHLVLFLKRNTDMIANTIMMNNDIDIQPATKTRSYIVRRDAIVSI
jgi:hypothetical protein